jgi:hypothetical protein
MGYHYENNELTDMLLMYAQCYQNTAAASRVRKAISGKTPFWATSFINLVQWGNRQDRTQYFRKQKKYIQSIFSVNTNILLRRFRRKFLRIMYSTSCYKERLNFENPLYFFFNFLEFLLYKSY